MIYEKILNLYRDNLDEGRIFLYENLPKLMRKNPLMKIKNYTYAKEDICSEAFMLADKIILRKDIDDKKKISKLRYLFNRWGGQLYNIINQYNQESYTIDDLKDWEKLVENVVDDVLTWILINNDILSPLEASVLEYKKQWRGNYEIARLMKTTYYNVRDIVEGVAVKVRKFLDENDGEDADDS